MALIRWNNRLPLADMFSNFFDSDFVDYFNRRGFDPAANIIEHPDSFELNLAAPGLKKEDFKIDLETPTLISAPITSSNIGLSLGKASIAQICI